MTKLAEGGPKEPSAEFFNSVRDFCTGWETVVLSPFGARTKTGTTKIEVRSNVSLGCDFELRPKRPV